MDNENNDAELEYKIITLGNSGVGKTSIINRFVDGIFNPDQLPTFGSAFTFKEIKVSKNKNKIIKLNLIDTSGQEQYRALSVSYFRNVDVVLFVFSLDLKSSFEQMQDWINTFNKNNSGTYVKKMYLIGNKNDLPQSVDQNEINEFATKNKLPYKSTSAKDLENNNINELFQEIGEDLYELYLESTQNQNPDLKSQNTQKTYSLNKQKKKSGKKKCCK